MQTVIAGAIGAILGAILGALLQYWFTKILEEKRLRRNLETHAYLDYIKFTTDLSKAERTNCPEHEKVEINKNLADARLRISVFGSSEVIKAIAASESMKSDDRAKDRFAEIYSAMRRQLSNDKIQNETIKQLLFKD